MTYRVDILRPGELDEADARAWSALQASHPSFTSPLLGPQFARAVGVVREDARVAVWRAGGRAAGFLAFHDRPGVFARPIGSPFSDLHGLVSAAGAIEPGRALDAADLKALKVSGLVDPYGLLMEGPQTETESRRIVLAGEAASYVEQLRARSRNGAKNRRRYSQRLEREIGPLSLVAPDASAAALERLLGWKSAQFRANGLHDVFGVRWTSALMRRLFETRRSDFSGLMISLYAGERHLAGQFGVRLGAHYHPWIAAMDPEARPYGPGALLQWMAIEAMPRLGLGVYELGPGSERWKQAFAQETLSLRAGLATAVNPIGRMAAAGERVMDWPSRRVTSVGRLRRRLDHIAAIELTFAGRTRGLIDAIAGLERRNASRQTPIGETA